MNRVSVLLPGSAYDILIGPGLLRSAGSSIRELLLCGKAFTVTDGNVGPLYGEALRESLLEAGIEPVLLTVPPGEGSKSEAVLSRLYTSMLAAKISRRDVVIALGGGVVGDLAGYAAATLLRGLPFVQIPTTLLAQVDSSVGGKTAINHQLGKNLIGAFHQPRLVLTDTDTLKTLPPREFACGMAEIVKHGAIADAELFSQIRDGQYDLETVIGRNCEIKRTFVEEDERDTGGRMTLNFGHTFGHVIEAQGGFSRYNHGEAVALGMVVAAELGERLGITKTGTSQELCAVLTKLGLPVRTGMTVDYTGIITDKKRMGGTLTLVLLKRIGEAVLCPIEVDRLTEVLR